jgi:hypothetical protein
VRETAAPSLALSIVFFLVAVLSLPRQNVLFVETETKPVFAQPAGHISAGVRLHHPHVAVLLYYLAVASGVLSCLLTSHLRVH